MPTGGKSSCPHSSLGGDFDFADPYPFYARARREQPVFYSPALKTWCVTRYDDIVTILNDPVRFSSHESVNGTFDYTPATGLPEESTPAKRPARSGSLCPLERISQTWIRRAISQAFAAERIGDREPMVRRIANNLIDRFAGRGRAEFVGQFSSPMPIRVILNVLGAPERHADKLTQWGRDWVALTSGRLTAGEEAGATTRLIEAQEYWLDLINERRAEPRQDLITGLIAASPDPDTPAGRQQIVNACSVVALAGHETTTNLLSICLYRLLSLPGQWHLVCEDPSNIAKAIEETLRADTPVQALMRTTTEPVEVAGVRIRRGERLALLFASANHDEAYFSDSARFDLSRQDAAAHLAFGRGIHFCVGAPLARLEGGVALAVLIERLPRLRMAPGHDVTFLTNPIHRGLRQLYIEWDS